MKCSAELRSGKFFAFEYSKVKLDIVPIAKGRRWISIGAVNE